MSHARDISQTLTARTLEIRATLFELEKGYQTYPDARFRHLVLDVLTLLTTAIEEFTAVDHDACLVRPSI